jgi:hypothetical protein
MNKFVLIDHSIVKTGGHYLEYAQNVLCTAKNKYEVYIATNGKIQDIQPLSEYKVLPYYTYDIWGNIPQLSKKRQLKGFGLRAKLSQLRFSLKNKVFISALGYAFEGRNSGDFFKEEEKPHVKVGVVCLGIFLLPIAIIAVLVKLFGRAIDKTVRFVMRFLGLGKLKFPGLHAILSKFKREMKRKKVSKAFGRETLRVLKAAKLSKGDIVFIPTLSTDDLEGIYQAIQISQAATECTWHLVFRRNIFDGREPEYSGQMAKRHKEQRIFAKFADIKNVFFYTDTEELTRQYERLCGIHFTTLPIPINPDFRLQDNQNVREPLIAVYAGDARKEKGYQYLPDIIDSVSDLTTSGRLCFELQSNTTFKRPQDDPETTLAKTELLSRNNSAVKLHTEALASAAYCDMVRNSNIGLLLYDRENYYARSSGALVECLAAGIPVIVPSASWLSAQLANVIRDYQLNLAKKYCENAVPCSKESKWNANSVLDAIKNISLFSQTEKNELFLSERLQTELSEYVILPKKDDWHAFSKEIYNKSLNERFFFLIEKVLEGESEKEASGGVNVAVYGKSSAKRKLLLVPENVNRLYIEYKLDERTSEGVVVRLSADYIDEHGYSIENSAIEHVSQGKGMTFPNLLKIPEGTSVVELSLSAQYYDAPAYCKETEVEFWYAPADEPISTAAYTYVDIKDVPNGLEEIVKNYTAYKDSAKEFSTRWNRVHTSENLIGMLSANAEGFSK